MPPAPSPRAADSRRQFLARAGQFGVVAALGACTPSALPPADSDSVADSDSLVVSATNPEWDLSWTDRLATAHDRIVFDVPSLAGGFSLDLATRYLDNCVAVYGAQANACVVLNVRTRAVGMALADPLWKRYALGAEYEVTDRVTGARAVRNPYLTVAADAGPGTGSVNDLVARGAVLIVCDFALGHLAGRLAERAGRNAEEVHQELRDGFVPGAFAVPSGIFGLARAQNDGCALFT